MKSGVVLLNLSLSDLVFSRRNPRKVKPSHEGHHRLVALIRSQGLLQPLVVRPIDGKPKRYEVVAGERRLRALREIHRNDGDPKIPCMVRDVDTAAADALSLGENFGRENMHPLDEADAFAKLASGEGKDAQAIAAEFGVTEHYVRQRMKLATLAEPVKEAYRQNQIDTSIAEAFAAVPEDRQLEAWKEVNGNPRHAEQVRNVIAHSWIDAEHALFELSSIPDSAVSRDLFSERVLVERQVFMRAQADALEMQRQALLEEGWNEVVVARREDVQDRLYAMDTLPQEFDEATNRKLAHIANRRHKLETTASSIEDGDGDRLNRLQERYDALEARERKIVENAKAHFSEETKAMATSFLILDPDGRVHREYRLPRPKRNQSSSSSGHARAGESAEKPKPPTSEDLSDAQRAVSFTHQALAVREALLKNTAARKRVLALIVHDKVRSEALAIRHEPNGTDLQASSEGFASPLLDRQKEKRSKIDPFGDQHYLPDREAYEHLAELTPSKLDALIDLLTVQCITAHLQRPTPLVQHLASELKVNVREFWRPDAQWLSGFKKIQLAHLIVELKGQVHAPAPEKKKSELVDVLAKLFTDAAVGKLDDKQLAAKVNGWLPANLREVEDDSTESVSESNRD